MVIGKRNETVPYSDSLLIGNPEWVNTSSIVSFSASVSATKVVTPRARAAPASSSSRSDPMP